MKLLRNYWIIEGIWVLITIFLSVIVILPIYFHKVDFPFYWINVLFVSGFITFTRWIFLWKFTPYAWHKPLKLALIFLMIPVVFIGTNKFYDFKIYLDEIGIQELVAGYDEHVQHNLSLYIRSEMIFFGTAFIITAFLIPLKMIWSIWKQYNRNEV